MSEKKQFDNDVANPRVSPKTEPEPDYVFGYPTMCASGLIEEIVGRPEEDGPVEGVSVTLHGFELVVQPLAHVPSHIRKIIANSWLPGDLAIFATYGLRRKEGAKTYGLAWQLTKQEQANLDEWELVDEGWFQKVVTEATLIGRVYPGHPETRGGSCIPIFAHILEGPGLLPAERFECGLGQLPVVPCLRPELGSYRSEVAMMSAMARARSTTRSAPPRTQPPLHVPPHQTKSHLGAHPTLAALMDYAVRPATVHDRDAIKLLHASWIANRREATETYCRVIDTFYRNAYESYIVAVNVADQPIGLLGIRRAPTKTITSLLDRKMPTCQFVSFCVTDATQHMGIGTALVSYLETRAKAEGFQNAVVLSGPRNQAKGWPFWNKWGGQPLTIIPDYYGVNIPATLWRKTL